MIKNWTAHTCKPSRAIQTRYMDVTSHPKALPSEQTGSCRASQHASTMSATLQGMACLNLCLTAQSPLSGECCTGTRERLRDLPDAERRAGAEQMALQMVQLLGVDDSDAETDDATDAGPQDSQQPPLAS